MKKWAKILLIIGIIWIIGVLLYLVFACPIYSTTPTCTSELMEMYGGCPDYGMRNHCLESGVFIPGFLILSLPAWIMFLIAAIWGRNKRKTKRKGVKRKT